MSEQVFCPNCQSADAEKIGNKITCTHCDAVYEIKKTGAAAVVKIGEVEKLKDRVSALEELLKPEPDGNEEPEEQEEDDILPP